MPFDQNNYRPEWVDFGEEEEEAPDFSPFAAALKKRFAQKPQMPTSREPHLETGMMKEGHEAALGGATKALGSGGMKSL